MTDITQKAMLCRQTLRWWYASKHDRQVSEEIAIQHNADDDAGRYNKQLVAREALKEVKRIGNEARKHHYAHTLAWEDWGARILPAAAYFEYTKDQAEFARQFSDAVDRFARAYPQILADAPTRLGSMFNPADFPPVDKIRDKFELSIAVTPIPAGADFRVSLNQDEHAKIQAEIEARVQATIKDATQELYGRLEKAVRHMHDRLSEPDRVFRDTLITNVRELVDLLPKLNIADDPDLAHMWQTVRRELLQHSPDKLRTDAEVRAKTAKSAQEILDAMGGYTS